MRCQNCGLIILNPSDGAETAAGEPGTDYCAGAGWGIHDHRHQLRGNPTLLFEGDTVEVFDCTICGNSKVETRNKSGEVVKVEWTPTL